MREFTIAVCLVLAACAKPLVPYSTNTRVKPRKAVTSSRRVNHSLLRRVEEASAASKALEQQGPGLVAQVGQFRTRETVGAVAAAAYSTKASVMPMRRPNKPIARSSVKPAASSSPVTAKASGDDGCRSRSSSRGVSLAVLEGRTFTSVGATKQEDLDHSTTRARSTDLPGRPASLASGMYQAEMAMRHQKSIGSVAMVALGLLSPARSATAEESDERVPDHPVPEDVWFLGGGVLWAESNVTANLNSGAIGAGALIDFEDDMGLDLFYQPWRHFNIALGYRDINLQISSVSEDWRGKAQIEQSGPVLFLATSL